MACRLFVPVMLPLAACNSGPAASATDASANEGAATMAAANGGVGLISSERW